MVFITPTGERLAKDRRQTKRWHTRASYAIRRSDGASSTIVVQNLSEGGFGAQDVAGVGDGEEVTFRLGRGGHAPARIVWRADGTIGCQFLRKVSAAEVALALATARPAADSDMQEH